MALQCSTVFVALADPDGKTLVRFYRQLFGQEPVWHVPEIYAEFQLPGLRLGIFKPSTIHRSEFESQAGSISLCIEVEQLEEAIASVEQAFTETRLTGDHLLPGDIITSSHGREVYAYDPAGNRLILHETHLPKMPKAEQPKADIHEIQLGEIQTENQKHQVLSDKQKRNNSSKSK
jgi:predicted enzyme related to lactoylglutathione lyase